MTPRFFSSFLAGRRHFSIAALRITLTIFCLITPVRLPADAHDTDQRTVTKLADGVYAIQHPFGNSGNTTVIIGDRQVFVVDSPFFPAFAREDIAQIRQWSDKPVAYLLNTHFHEDHNTGNRAYNECIPGPDHHCSRKY
jgi:cyclase